MTANETNNTSMQRQPWSFKSKVLATCAVVLSVIALVAGMRLTVAAFSANDYLKAVAATNEAANLLSSDQLTGFSSTLDNLDSKLIPKKSLVVGSGTAESGTTFEFSIFNYLQNDPTIWCQKNIKYTITVEVEGSKLPEICRLGIKDDMDKAVSFMQQANGSYSATLDGQSLAGRRQSKNQYVIQLPQADINNTTFKVRVDVTDAGGTMIRSMAADIMPSLAAEVKATTWDITSVDMRGDNKPNDFDAYNYNIAVSGAEAEVTFTWNKSLVQLDPFFEEKHKGATVNGNTATLTLQPGITRVNFFRIDGAINEDTKWTDLGVA